MKRLGMLQRMSFVVGATALAAMGFTACGDDDDGGTTYDARVNYDAPITFDASVKDAPTPDARLPDARTPDAGPTFSGTIAVHDVELFGTGGAFHGLQLTIGFNQRGTPVVDGFSPPGGSPIGCSGSIVNNTPAQNPPDVDEGTVKISITPSGGSANTLPDCTLVSGEYRCIAGMGSAGTLAAATMNADKIITFTNTTPSAPAFSPSVVGAWLVIPGATPTAFPITGVSGTSAGLQLVATPPASPVGAWFIQHGIGPQLYQSAPDGSGLGAAPDLLADTATVNIQIVPGGGNHFQAYTSPALNAADHFTLDATTTGYFTNGIDLNSATDLTFNCTGTGCEGGGANATILNIETTDMAGGGPGELLPGTLRATVQCNALTADVKLTTQALALLKAANPRKMRISFFRDNADIQTALSKPLSVAAGHGVVVFKDIPPP